MSPQRPTHSEIFAEQSEILRALTHLTDTVGNLSKDVAVIRQTLGEERVTEDGKVVGTGLCGRVIKAEAEISAFTGLKNKGVGAVAALTLVAGLLILGVKEWVQSIIPQAV